MTITKTQITTWLTNAATVLETNKEYLTDLDAPIGDSDHGSNIARGFAAVVEKLPSVAEKDIGTILKTTAMTLMSKVGGASGMLYGNFFMKAALVAKDKEELTSDELLKLLEDGVAGIIARGRANLGDKTMIDTWAPAVEAFKSALTDGDNLPAALAATVTAAEEGMKATTSMIAKKGRASYLGERSIGHQDPGATSTHLILQELAKTISA